MKKICKNCRFWLNSNEDYHGWSDCINRHIENNIESYIEDAMVNIETHKEFGCILWGKREC